MPDISVIVVTKRFGGIDILADCLSRQTFTNYELILVDELYEQRKELVVPYLADKLPNIKIIHTPSKMRKPKRKYGLCNALNTGLLRSHGELIVWLQDYIWLQPDALERYWNGYNQFPNKLIGGLKDHYVGPIANNPKGLISIWNQDWQGDPATKGILSERDNRYKSIQIPEGAELIELMPLVYELCNASMPYTLAVALNGVNEELDDGRAYDNQDISFRARMLGYPTVIDTKNVAREFNHWEYFGEDDKMSPRSVDKKPPSSSNYELLNKILIGIEQGKYPLRAPNDFMLVAR